MHKIVIHNQNQKSVPKLHLKQIFLNGLISINLTDFAIVRETPLVSAKLQQTPSKSVTLLLFPSLVDSVELKKSVKVRWNPWSANVHYKCSPPKLWRTFLNSSGILWSDCCGLLRNFSVQRSRPGYCGAVWQVLADSVGVWRTLTEFCGHWRKW